MCVWGGGRSFRSCRSCRPLFHFPGNGAQHFSCRAALDLRLPWCVGVSDGDSGFPSSVTRTPQCPMSRSNLLRPASASLLPCGSPPPLQPSGWRTQHGGVNLQLSPCPQQITRVLLASFGALVWLLLLGSPPTPPLRVGGWVRESALPSKTCVCMRRCRCTVGSVEIAFRYRGWGPRLMTARVSAPLEVSTNKLTVPVASVCALMKPDLKTGGRRIGGVGRMGHCARERTSWVLGPSPGVGAIVNAELPPSLPTPFPLAQLQAKFQSPSQKVRRVSVVENSRVRGGGCTGRARGAGKWRTPQTCCWGLERRPKNREFVIQNHESEASNCKSVLWRRCSHNSGTSPAPGSRSLACATATRLGPLMAEFVLCHWTLLLTLTKEKRHRRNQQREQCGLTGAPRSDKPVVVRGGCRRGRVSVPVGTPGCTYVFTFRQGILHTMDACSSKALQWGRGSGERGPQTHSTT